MRMLWDGSAALRASEQASARAPARYALLFTRQPHRRRTAWKQDYMRIHYYITTLHGMRMGAHPTYIHTRRREVAAL